VQATGKPVVVLLINGRPLSINSIAENVPAILEGFYLGEEGGTAAARVLFGDVAPGGKLPITFPHSVGDLPDFYNHKPSNNRTYAFSTRQPLFPFGYGLSYTTFKFENLRAEPEHIETGGTAKIFIDVTNTGSRAGDEVPQLYVHQQIASVTRPVKLLRGFQRITLQPGEKRTVTFTIGPNDLSLLGADMQPVVEPGVFDIMVGPSSADTTMLHSTKVEIIWTIIPVLILVVVAIPAAELILKMEDMRNADLSVRVTGYQWKWQYQYMDAGEGINFFSTLKQDSNFARQLNSGIDPKSVKNYLLDVDHPLVVPSGTKVRIILTSQDVIHAWYVPDFGIKRSAIPGFINELWFKVDSGKEGIYRGQCAALCGRDHGFMPVVVDVRTPDDFKKWVDEQKAALKQASAPAADAPRSAQALN